MFTLIFAKFIKALANWKLERGATVGHIQHLLGSRSLVSAVVTPVRLGTASLLVPLLIVVWAMNPLGGQLSLRVVSKETNVTVVDTPFVYVNPSFSYDTRAYGAVDVAGDSFAEAPSDVAYDRAVDNVFTLSLMSPNSSKNGTQDLFGNIQIPLIEHLMLHEPATADGWLYTTDWDLDGVSAALFHAAGLGRASTKPIYASIIGLPYKANLTGTATNTNSTESQHDERLHRIKDDLFGHDAVNTQNEFMMNTSYMYANCSTKPVKIGQVVTSDNVKRLRGASHFPNTTIGVANSGNGFSIAYDNHHNLNSTTARTITVRSWLGKYFYEDPGNGTSVSHEKEFISEASCVITQTYVEALVRCPTQNNCTVAKIRNSRTGNKAHAALTALDGITFPASLLDQSDPVYMEDIRQKYAARAAKSFFDYFVNASSTAMPSDFNLGPLESYFARPDAPYKASQGATGASSGDTDQSPITDVGDQLFSWRLSQLMNTYWLASVEPFSVVSGVDLDAIQNEEANPLPSAQGHMYVERIVLRCHTPYFAVLLVISLGLCAVGMVTAYLDATRRGPDVLDDFVNSLRHNPYVHVDTLGPSMQDGQEISRRLRNTVVQMGDVRPEDHVGYVAIGTPNERQPVERLDPRRHYL